MRGWRRETISLEKKKSPASSALTSEYTINLMIWVIVRTGPLLEGIEKSLESIIWDTAQLQEQLMLR